MIFAISFEIICMEKSAYYRITKHKNTVFVTGGLLFVCQIVVFIMQKDEMM
jgi:hypothetical protein